MSALQHNNDSIDINGILKLLPHRYPFVLVDRILELELGERAVGLKNVTINEPFFQGHFPIDPIMPGVLILESMAQVGGLLAYLTDQDKFEGELQKVKTIGASSGMFFLVGLLWQIQYYEKLI